MTDADFQSRFRAYVKAGMLLTEARNRALQECGLRTQQPDGAKMGPPITQSFDEAKAKRVIHTINWNQRRKP